MNEKIIIEMGSQIYSIEFLISFLTIYNNIVCTDGKVPAKIILLYGGISSYDLYCRYILPTHVSSKKEIETKDAPMF